jgi:hypothetical protein
MKLRIIKLFAFFLNRPQLFQSHKSSKAEQNQSSAHRSSSIVMNGPWENATQGTSVSCAARLHPLSQAKKQTASGLLLSFIVAVSQEWFVGMVLISWSLDSYSSIFVLSINLWL